MNSAPLVSVVVATHNRATLLPTSIDSLLKQTYQNFELVIVDDASADSTPAVLNELRNHDARIRTLRSDSNLGPGGARNLGVAAAKGAYIAIMDDDDICHPDRLQTQVGILSAKSCECITFSPVAWFRGAGDVFNVFPSEAAENKFPRDPDAVFEALYLHGNRIPNVTIMASRGLWLENPYPEKPWIGEDWIWAMRCAAKSIPFEYSCDPLVMLRRDGNHPSLMKRSAEALAAQRVVIKTMRDWLKSAGISRYDHLHRRATSRRMVREARCWRGTKGLAWSFMAWMLDPSNGLAMKTSEELIKAAGAKFRVGLG